MKIDCRQGLLGSRIEIWRSGGVENDQNRAAEPLEYLPGPKTPIKNKNQKNVEISTENVPYQAALCCSLQVMRSWMGLLFWL